MTVSKRYAHIEVGSTQLLWELAAERTVERLVQRFLDLGESEDRESERVGVPLVPEELKNLRGFHSQTLHVAR